MVGAGPRITACGALLLVGCALGAVSGQFPDDGGKNHGDGGTVADAGPDQSESGGSPDGSDGGSPPSDAAPFDQQVPEGAASYTVGGSVSGLSAGDTLPLQLNGGGPISITTNGPFTFPGALASGSSYQVTATNPMSPIAETCQVSNGSGTIGNANVNNVQVTCACTATTCGAQGANCGSISDGCGGTLVCGTCTMVPQTCGGGGTPNVCGACGVAVANTTIGSGGSLTSCDGRFTLAMQASDGNLVLYFGNSPLWSSNTAGNPGAYVVMQGDGNFVVYSVSNVALWSSVTAGNSGAYVDVQNDGNLVVYGVSMNALWSSGTCCH